MEKPTVPEVMLLVKEIYNRNPVGCCLHIALDDGNLHDPHIAFCHSEAIRKKHADCQEVAELMSRMSKTQRKKLYQQR